MQLQPTHLKNDTIQLIPLQPDDFEKLYAIASDPLIWEQHPTPDRYKREIFKSFFDTGLASDGAFLIYDIVQNDLIGCTRFYPHESEATAIHIGFTFFKRSSWGTNHNRKTKELMLNYAFENMEKVYFQIGATNFRSQKAVGKLGAKKVGEQSVAYTPIEEVKPNFIYEIRKEDWI
jgi:RimJ/RimL family protein N-acetyltransferase